MNSAESFKKRLTALMVICVVFATAVIGRAAWVQVMNNPRLEHMAHRQFQSKVLMTPRRGSIVDRNGEPLAINVENNSLAANPEKIKNPRILSRLLAKALDIPHAKLISHLSGKKEFIWIKRHMSDAELAHLKKWRIMDSEGDFASGLFLVKESHRIYPHNELGAHVLGTVNVDSDGTEGTELWMNAKLKGRVASVTAVKDAMGRATFIDSVAADEVHEGEKVTLTIDASLQFAVEQELKAAIQKSSAKSGSVIVMNAVNGEVLAMANEPSFNPNAKNVPLDHRRNRVLTDGYEPGSTMKAVLIASAMSHGWKLSDQVWGGEGQFMVQGHKISEAEVKEKFEWLSLKKIIQVSSNVGAAKVALKLGADHYLSDLKSFGFGAKTNTGFPGEISGRIPPRKAWQPLSLANIGFGQGVLVTPMQMTRAYAAFLNGGWLVQPTLIKHDGANQGEAPKRIILQKVADSVLEALATVTQEGGTGIKAGLDGYRVAGKTGTAQMVDPNSGKYSKSAHIASFIGFALDVTPKIVILTRIDEPKGVYYAAETAAPLFHDVLNAVATRFSLPTTVPVPMNRVLATTKTFDQLKVSQAKAIQVAAVTPIAIDGHGAMLWKMPSMHGLTPREAMRSLQGHNFQVEIHGLGVIDAQTPLEGSAVAEGDTIKFHLNEP